MSVGRAVITGGGGQLGTDLSAILEGNGEVLCLDRAALDVTDDVAVERTIADFGPDVVFNCAAFHNVNLCEREEDTASAVNVRAVKRLAEGCAARGAKLVHFSTNYVFDGTAADAYTERDLPNPRSVYALTKLAGEHAARAYEPSALVVRTAGLYGLASSASKGGNFVERVIGRGRAGEAIRMVADQRLTPTFTADLAPAVVAAVEAGAEGLLHLTSAGSCSWYDFAVAALDDAGIEATVESVETTPQEGVADRPLNGVLADEAARALGLPALRPWPEALADYVARAQLVYS